MSRCYRCTAYPKPSAIPLILIIRAVRRGGSMVSKTGGNRAPMPPVMKVRSRSTPHDTTRRG